MSSNPTIDGAAFDGLHSEHKELRTMVEDTRESIGQMAQSQIRVEGKIDTLTTLLSGLEGRQERSEQRIDKIQEKNSLEFRRLDDKVNSLSTKVWMGAGAIALVSLLPAILKIAALAATL